MDRKKILIIISLVAFGAILGGAYWYFSKSGVAPLSPGAFFPGESETRTTPIVPREGEELPDEQAFTPGSGAPIPRLYELHKVPVAGAGFVETKNKKGVLMTVTARYIERGLGYIFETPLSTYAESRIVNETRPSISEALWGNNGKSVILRSIDDKSGGIIKSAILNISNPVASLAQSTSTESIDAGFLKTEEVFLPNFIPFMAASEDSVDKVFYLENGVDAAVGSISTSKHSAVTKIFKSSFTEWLPQFPNQNLITLTTRPSATVPGHLFFLDPKTKSVTKIIGNINGLTTLTSNNGKFVLYSETKDGHPELALYDVTKKESSLISIQTLPEKCAWGKKDPIFVYCAVPQNIPSAIYPDGWYQGVVSFSDDIWKINTKTLSNQKIMSPKELGAPVLDIINPLLSSDDEYLLFMNKVTGTPWVYRINESTSLAAPTSSVVVPPSVISPDMKKLR